MWISLFSQGIRPTSPSHTLTAYTSPCCYFTYNSTVTCILKYTVKNATYPYDILQTDNKASAHKLSFCWFPLYYRTVCNSNSPLHLHHPFFFPHHKVEQMTPGRYQTFPDSLPQQFVCQICCNLGHRYFSSHQ